MGIRIGTRNYYNEVMADNPVAYWRLGEPNGATTAIDEKGTYNGTYVGSPLGGVSGALADNTAVTFNGSSQYVNGGVATLTSASGTLEAWFKLTSLPAADGDTMILVSVTVAEETDANQIYIGVNRASGVTYPSLAIRTGTPGVSHYIARGSTALSTGVWYHLMLSKTDGSAPILYLDTAVQTLTITSGDSNNGKWWDDFRAGNKTFGIAARIFVAIERYAAATVDEVAIYNTALSPATVLRHYRASL